MKIGMQSRRWLVVAGTLCLAVVGCASTSAQDAWDAELAAVRARVDAAEERAMAAEASARRAEARAEAAEAAAQAARDQALSASSKAESVFTQSLRK